jgi:SGNH domain (fused to AT3 domains)
MLRGVGSSRRFASANGLLGGLIARQDGIPERWSAKARHYSKAVDLMAAKQWPDDAEEIHRGQLPTFGKQPSQVPYKVLVWGDSHAKSIVPAVADLCLEKGQTGTLAAFSATSPTLGFYRHNQHGLDSKSPAWAAKVLEFIRHHQIPRVVLTAKWQDIPGNEPERFGKALMDTVKQLQQAGARVWILLDVPRQTFDVPKALAMYEMFPAARRDPRLQSQTLERYREQNRVMEDLIPLLQQQGAHVLDATSLLFDSKGRSLLEHDGEALYGDSNHLTIQGALRLKPLLRTVLED